jgi:hypothetical protein
MGRPVPQNCNIDQATEQAKTKRVSEGWSNLKLKYPGLVVFDPNDAICSEGTCPVIQNGHSIYKDDNHLSYSGSMLIGEKFWPKHVTPKE